MALIVETGAVVIGADSYLSVVDATTYLVSRGKGDAWDAVDDQEAALRKATDYITQAYRGRWTGYRFTVSQSLDWPRAWVPIPDVPSGYGAFSAFVSNTIVPLEVKNACAELALISSVTDLTATLTRPKIRTKVGEIEVQYNPYSPEYPRFRHIDMMFNPYLNSRGVNYALVRA